MLLTRLTLHPDIWTIFEILIMFILTIYFEIISPSKNGKLTILKSKSSRLS